MISVSEATSIVLSHVYQSQAVLCSITEAVGKILAEDIKADRDMPPFNRVTMDGIAVRAKTWEEGKRRFFIEGMQAAGEIQKKLKDPENAIEVMTGAMLPEGTDAVVRYEDLTMEAPYATITVDRISQWQSVHLKGQDAKKDEVLLSSGQILSSAEIALLASVGKSKVLVKSFPKTAIVASGDELVEVDAAPAPQQIRRSNTYAIQAAMREMSWDGDQFHLPDDKAVLTKSIAGIVEKYDTIILSGGVSQGKLDFIPTVMEELGIKKLFHQVSQRPGKPFWFGTSTKGKVVFALPGNPVSTFMCFYRYVKPWVLKSLSVSVGPQYAILAKDFLFAPKLTYFLQVSIKNEAGKLMAYPDAGGGSGDFVNLKKIDGFIELPAEKQDFKTGEVFPFFAFRL